MSKPQTRDAAILATLGALYKLLRASLPIANSPRINDFKNIDTATRYIGSSGNVKKALRSDLPAEALTLINNELDDKTATPEVVAKRLATNSDFKQQLSNLGFKDEFLTPSKQTEDQDQEEEKKTIAQEQEEEKKTISLAQEQDVDNDDYIARESARLGAKLITLRQEREAREAAKQLKEAQSKEKLIKEAQAKEKLRILEEIREKYGEEGYNMFLELLADGRPTDEEIPTLYNMFKKTVDAPEPKPTTRQMIDEMKTDIQTDIQDLKRGVARLESSTSDIMSAISNTPQLNDIRQQLLNTADDNSILKNKQVPDNEKKLPGMNIDKKIIDELVRAVPENNRQILGPAINGLMGTSLNLNQVVSGLVGLAVSIPLSPLAGTVASNLLNTVMDQYDINLNNFLTPEQQRSVISEPASMATTPSASVTSVTGPAVARPAVEGGNQLLQRLDSLFNFVRENARAPRASEILGGTMAGAIGGGVSAGLSTGRAGGAIQGAMIGGVEGLGVGTLITPLMVEAYFTQRGVPINDDLRRKINYVSLIAPTAFAGLLGAGMGYTPAGAQVMGTGVISGAGITERKLIATPDAVAQTKVQAEDKAPTYKTWQPKSISPTTDILNETQQEKYADDLEFTAFNYIAPTSEGAPGTVDTNPLKRSQAQADALRYTDAGIYIPYILFNKINDANEMNPERLNKLALGVELPPMEFLPQDNEVTFENEATKQYVNNENTAIEFLSPYSDFSNVDNFWTKNPTSILYTINP
jgi:hypothetical protein